MSRPSEMAADDQDETGMTVDTAALDDHIFGRGDQPLPGLPGQGRKPREWGVELTPLAADLPNPAGYFPAKVRITLIDRETGRRVGSRVLPWEEFKDSAHVATLVNIAEGVHE